MQSVTFTLWPPGGYFQPVERLMMETAGVERRAIHHMRLLSDGRCTTLYEIDGTCKALEDICETSDDIIDYQIIEQCDSVLVHAHFYPTDMVESLQSVIRDYEVVVDAPMFFVGERGLQITLVGEENVLREALFAGPEEIGLEVERVGEFAMDQEHLVSELTPRQREVLKVAIEMGYYGTPRNATQSDIAERLDCSSTAVGQNLRKIEASILGQIPI